VFELRARPWATLPANITVEAAPAMVAVFIACGGVCDASDRE
jgi:hypothetical protein